MSHDGHLNQQSLQPVVGGFFETPSCQVVSTLADVKNPNGRVWMGKKTLQLPSGYVKIAIENGHRNSGFSH